MSDQVGNTLRGPPAAVHRKTRIFNVREFLAEPTGKDGTVEVKVRPTTTRWEVFGPVAAMALNAILPTCSLLS